MKDRLPLRILAQPNDTTCGPSCLHAVYRYFGEHLSLDSVIKNIHELESGGTLAVFLGCDALKRGYNARIYTYNLKAFDPTWFDMPGIDLPAKLKAQLKYKHSKKLHIASHGYIEFLRLGGKIYMEDLTTTLIRKYLKRGIPIITGLSSTFLYRSPREVGFVGDWDDVRGESAGHFVVLSGYNKETRRVHIADPMLPNPFAEGNYYDIDIDRVLCAILLGVLTYDANLLIIAPNNEGKKT